MEKFYFKTLSFLLALLGFGFVSCNDNDSLVEYGVPNAKFRIKGTVVDEQTGRQLEGIRTVMLKEYEDSSYYMSDTMFSDRNGFFELVIPEWPAPTDFLLFIDDVDGEENGLYESQKHTVKFSGNFSDGTGSWYEGEEVKNLGEIKLTKKLE